MIGSGLGGLTAAAHYQRGGGHVLGSRRSHREGWEASFDNLDRVLAA